MSIEAGIHPNAGGGGGRKPRLIPVILTLILIACSTIMGCNGHNNPVDATGSLDIGRSLQGFSSLQSLGSAYSMDCASSIWANPVPDPETYIGDIAPSGSSAYAKAIVWQSNELGSEVTILVYDAEDDLEYWDSFSAEAGPGSPLCKHPVVEITYSSEGEDETDGTLRIHVVWSEYTDYGSPAGNNFDLYYRYLEFSVEDGDVDWSPDEDEICWIECSDDELDDIQPDICVLHSVNDVYIVYLEDNPSSRDNIRCACHEYDDMDDPDDWGGGSMTVSSSLNDEKWAPSIDAGVFSGYWSPIGSVAFVWCELVDDEDYDDWQVYYGEYHEVYGLGDTQITGISCAENQINYMPKIDIAPQSGYFAEAIIVYDSAKWDDEEEEFYDWRVRMAVTPYHDDDDDHIALNVYGWSRASDVCCYQPEEGEEWDKEGWFALAYHRSEYDDDWAVRAHSGYFIVDYEEPGSFTIVDYYDYEFNGSDAQWSFDDPFRIPCIALSNPDGYIREKQLYVGYIEDYYHSSYLKYGTIYN